MLIQYAVGLAFIVPPLMASSYSLARSIEAIGVYWLAITLISTPIILVFGLPIFHLLRRRGKASKVVLGVAGAITALAISAILTFPIYSPGFSAGQSYYGEYREMVVDGIPTFWGWVSYVEGILMYSIHGMLGALAFRFGWEKANPVVNANPTQS